MEKKDVYLTRSNIAPILILSSKFERDPLPFRLQPNLRIIVPLEEYAAFCEYELKNDLLYSTAEEMQSIAAKYRLEPSGTRGQLFSCFAKDICFAIMKELYYAELKGKECTQIVHQISDSKLSLGIEKINEVYDNANPYIVPTLINHMRSRGYNFEGLKSNKNFTSFKYAVTLFFLAETQVIWSYL